MEKDFDKWNEIKNQPDNWMIFCPTCFHIRGARRHLYFDYNIRK